MIAASTIQLLRIHFSVFLMPVYWFALSQLNSINNKDALLCFIILHLLVYPASNGYNSYMDRDTESIGGIKSPLQPTKQLFYVSLLMDITALLLSLLISVYFTVGLLLYILASRAYSYRGIRLKKYAIPGYLTVIIFQGAVTYWLVTHAASVTKSTEIPVYGMAIASLLIGSFYPLTQIYQHRQDKKDGVTTLSYVLGYRGTFLFSGIVFAAAMTGLWLLLSSQHNMDGFWITQIFLLPVTVYFLWWFSKVYRDSNEASFTNTMRMNLIASVCSNAAFIFLFIKSIL